MSTASVKIKKKIEDLDELHLQSRSPKSAHGACLNPVLACIPKMASIISTAPPFCSPEIDYGCRATRAGAIRRKIPLIPKEAKNGRGFEPREPTSPKVSCIGQVKKKKEEEQRLGRSQDRPPLSSETKPLVSPYGAKFSELKSIFSGKKVLETAFCESQEISVNNFPSLGQMKRFSSSRHYDALANVWSQESNVAMK